MENRDIPQTMEHCLSNRRKKALLRRIERSFERAVISLTELRQESLNTFDGTKYRELEIEGMVNRVLGVRKLLKELLKETAKDLKAFHGENE